MRRFLRRRRARCDSGFSLVELLVAMGIFLVVVAALMSQLTSAQRSQHYAQDRATILDQCRASMARMTLDARQAASIDPNSTPTHLVMTTYVDALLTTVTYDISGTNLMRTVQGRASETLQTNLANTSIFTYEPSASNAQTVAILLQVKPPASPNTVISLSSEAHLRNIDPGG